MPDKLLVANWKMNPPHLAEAVALTRAILAAVAGKKTGVVLCPPFVYLTAVGREIKNIRHVFLGAQDVFGAPSGKHTGEVSPIMLKNIGATHVILGHSERRALGETDEIVNKKVKAALSVGLSVVLCVGEPAAVRRKGLPAAQMFVRQQLRASLKGVRAANFSALASRLLVTYEPVWAISSGVVSSRRADKPESARKMLNFIRKIASQLLHVSGISLSVLYGGSVTSANAAAFLRNEQINGALIGAASLNSADFRKIIKLTSGF